MIKVYTGIKGFALALFFIAGIVLFVSVLCWGITKVAELFLPLLIVLSYLLIIVFVMGILPATFLEDRRPSLCVMSMLMSHVLGVATWMMSFLFVIKTLGFWGIFFAFLFQFLAPIALLAAIIKGSWHVAAHLSIWIGFTYGMRFYSQWLLSLKPRENKKRDVIDVDVVEVSDHPLD